MGKLGIEEEWKKRKEKGVRFALFHPKLKVNTFFFFFNEIGSLGCFGGPGEMVLSVDEVLRLVDAI